MAIRSDEITSIIKSAIDGFEAGVETRSVGTVVEVGDGIAQIYGLAGALSSELVEFPGGLMGMALNLDEETVGAVVAIARDLGLPIRFVGVGEKVEDLLPFEAEEFVSSLFEA